ncbi:hypothetical protein F4805DRAFT_452027 [Annulohypoxylon moriforme]|nr:hypothetical protein F4805DRAFT_452027 [Annulohypoxylon moriforme]
MQELARQDHHVTELQVDARYLNIGLSNSILDNPSATYDEFVALLRKPGFRRLDLDLSVTQESLSWNSYRTGYLQRALAEAKDLEHFSFRSSIRHDPDGPLPGSPGSIEYFVPLRSVFPIERWPRLRHFGLNNFLVTQEDVLALLAALPSTVRTIELGFLRFLDDSGSHEGLLNDMRDTLGWQDRAEEERPKVTISTEMADHGWSGRAIWVDKEIDDFLYRGGENVFGHDGWGPNRIAQGFGTVRDAFDPAWERPWVSYEKYQELGIYSGTPWPLRKREMQTTAE